MKDAAPRPGHAYPRNITPMPMLNVTGLTKRFGALRAVNDVSFEVAEGEILGLIGPNGSGKSTTFNLIAGALKPDAGSVRFRGEEVARSEERRVGKEGRHGWWQ